MQQTPWSMQLIKQCEKESGQAMLCDEQSLVFFATDFGKLRQANPAVVCSPTSEKIPTILHFAHQHKLSLTIRGNGLSQGGQAISEKGLIVHLKHLNRVLEKESETIWVEANCSWAKLIETSLKTHQIPYVLPYNCNLSVAGVLSAGGVGSSSFKFGSVSAGVDALDLILANGQKSLVDSKSPLFQACLSGQGQFALISKASIRLRKCLSQVRTFFLVYLDKDKWLKDLSELRSKADYIEAFCSPAPQGARWVDDKRIPFAQWLFSIHLSFEFESKPPEFNDFAKILKPWRVLHKQDEPIFSYLHRHDSRFEVMKLSGQWDLAHPWYECFISGTILANQLENLLQILPLHYATVVQIVPIAEQPQTGFLMLPKTKEIFALMILNPGVNSLFVPSCLQAMEILDTEFLNQGGKRYLSGFLGENVKAEYWSKHFGPLFSTWVESKNEFDPHQIFCSALFPKI